VTIEKELEEAISNCDQVMVSVRSRISDLKKQLANVESTLIEAKLQKEKFIDNLRRAKESNVNQPLTLREEDILRFKEELPRILKLLNK
jgi:hypothetical protein